MANLETLFIEIDGSAEKASSGIDILVGSLSRLGGVVSAQVGALKEFASAIAKIAKVSAGGNAFKGITSSGVSKGITENTKSVSKYADTMKKVGSEVQKVTDNIGANQQATSTSFRDAQKYLTANKLDLMQWRLESMRDKYKTEAESGKRDNLWLQEKALQLKNYEAQIESYRRSLYGVKEATKEITEETKPAHNALSSMFSTIGRLGKMMLLRMAIRALIKIAKQGLQNYYQYSKSINGAFYQASQKLQTESATTGNQLGAMLGSLLTSLYPILSAVLEIVNKVAEAFTVLFAVLGGQSTYSRAVNDVNTLGKAASGTSSKMKELLASFDELNVITSESGGGGSNNNMFGGAFEEVELPQWLQDIGDFIQEWMPIIKDGLLAGGIALALSTIWGWISKIFGIGSTAGAIATTAALGTAAAETGALSAAAPIAAGGMEDISNAMKTMTVPAGFTVFAGEVGAVSLAAPAAAAGLEAMAVAIPKLTAALGGMSIITALIAAIGELLSSLAKSIKIGTDIDREDFDKFKKELEDWEKKKLVKSLSVSSNMGQVALQMKSIDNWVLTGVKKDLYIDVNDSKLNDAIIKINTYMSQRSVKTVGILFNETQYNEFWMRANAIYDYIYGNHNKAVGIAFNETQYNEFWMRANSIYDYIFGKHNKVVGIAFNETQYNEFWMRANAIYDYINGKHDKIVGIAFNSAEYILFVSQMAVISAWVDKQSRKVIPVILDGIVTFLAESAAIDLWVLKNHTKNIAIGFEGWSDFALKVSVINNWVSSSFNKNISVVIGNYDYFTKLQSAINDWASKTETKRIDAYITFANWETFLTAVSALQSWINARSIKYVYVEYIDNGRRPTYDYDEVNYSSPAVSGLTSALTGLNKMAGDAMAANAETEWSSARDNAIYKDYGVDKDSAGGAVVGLINQLLGYADGAYGIPKGDLFIANEAGAELVGSMNGKTTVANQGQIIEGIRSGVESANAEQNSLLRQQNELLRGILEKEASVRIGASAALGRVAKQSLDMYGVVGG